MIDFDYLENNKEYLRISCLTSELIQHLVIEKICDNDKLMELGNNIPELKNKSRDYMFAGNKFEKNHYFEFGNNLENYTKICEVTR